MFFVLLYIYRQWWTEKSRFVLKSGGLRPTNDIDKLLQKFLAGERGDDFELDDVNLPNVDTVDVEKRRLQILLQNIKPSLVVFMIFYYLISAFGDCLLTAIVEILVANQFFQ